MDKWNALVVSLLILSVTALLLSLVVADVAKTRAYIAAGYTRGAFAGSAGPQWMKP